MGFLLETICDAIEVAPTGQKLYYEGSSGERRYLELATDDLHTLVDEYRKLERQLHESLARS